MTFFIDDSPPCTVRPTKLLSEDYTAEAVEPMLLHVCHTHPVKLLRHLAAYVLARGSDNLTLLEISRISRIVDETLEYGGEDAWLFLNKQMVSAMEWWFKLDSKDWPEP